MSITKKLACAVMLSLCAGLTLTSETWIPERESNVAAQVVSARTTQVFVPPMQSYWSVLAMASSR